MQVNTATFDLAPAELGVPLKAAHAGRTYRLVHKLRPPAHDDWVAYEAALRLSVEELDPAEQDSEPRYRFDAHNSEAAQLLWERLILAADGYQHDANDDNDADDWKTKVPLAHKEAAVRSLTLVAPAELTEAQPGDLLPLTAERIPVILEAARAGEVYPRLVHWFRPPSLEEERRYRRLMAETVLVGGSRGSRALIPARLPALCRLYDSLILSAENYSLDGSADISPEKLARHMDSWHKRFAVQALFGDAADIGNGPAATEPVGTVQDVQPEVSA